MALLQGPHSMVYRYDAEERVRFVKERCIGKTSNRLGDASCSSMTCEWFLQHEGLQPS
jgi:hypothetical protein